MDPKTKTLTYAYLFELNDEIDDVIEFFVENSIRIDCQYNTELTLDAQSMFINQEDTQASAMAQGDLSENFRIKIFADSQYRQEVTSDSILNMGHDVYVSVEQDKHWRPCKKFIRLSSALLTPHLISCRLLSGLDRSF